MPKKVIAPESFEAVLDEVSKEMKNILDDSPPDDREEMKAFVILLNTLKVIVDNTLQYLPEGERSDVVDMCGTWMCVGILLGKAPKRLAEILKRTRAKIEEASQ